MTSSSQEVACVYCNRLDLMSQHALGRHQAQSLCCINALPWAEQQLLSPISKPHRGNQPSDDDLSVDSSWNSPQGAMPSPPHKQAFLMERVAIPTHDMDFVTRQTWALVGPMFDEASAHDSSDDSSASDYGANRNSDPNTQDSGKRTCLWADYPEQK